MLRQEEKVKSSRFYNEYYGHKVRDLKVLYPVLRSHCQSLIWTAGDSSLDNKYWFNDPRPSVGPYSLVLDPPSSNADITYWFNYLDQERNSNTQNGKNKSSRYTINTAVEASTLNARSFALRPQDRFLRDNISSDDILIVSVGGNDVAMAPLPCTIASILSLVLFLPTNCIERGCVRGTVPLDDWCCGCGPSTLSCLCACPPCLGYMVHLFGTRTRHYIQRLTAKTKPKKILVCMIYYPDERATPSWAGPALAALGYNKNPRKLQAMIRKAFVEATSNIQIPGTEVVPVFLPNVLDGKNSADYIARVEPSSQGGRKMAEYLLDIIDGNTGYGTLAPTNTQAPLEAHFMTDR